VVGLGYLESWFEYLPGNRLDVSWRVTSDSNVTVEWLTLLLRILKVPLSKLKPKIGILTEIFVVLISPFRKMP
jgi:hypothetical protein